VDGGLTFKVLQLQLWLGFFRPATQTVEGALYDYYYYLLFSFRIRC
jgi:hypothetical protein